MNFMSNLSTRKNSVNSSLATIKIPKDINQTINKNKQKSKIRFSHQQQLEVPKKLQRNSSYKQNLNIDCFDQSKLFCMNHQNKQATHMVFGDTQSPMYYCQRCAILIASKGFNIQSLGIQNKQNKNKMNSKRGSFSQFDRKQNLTYNKNTSMQQKSNTKNKIPQPIKINLSNQIITQLQQIWKSLKTNRQSNLNQIDMYINTLNENIDFIEDYYYILHEYIEKQKNIQLKDILSKKQLLEQLRSEVSNYFMKNFTTVKELKDKLIHYGECNLDIYQQTMEKANQHKFSLNFQAAIEQVNLLNNQRESTVHKMGQEITKIIKSFNILNQKNDSFEYKQRNSIHNKDHRPVSCMKKQGDSINKGNQISKVKFEHANKQNEYRKKQVQIGGVNNVESSVRSLQLSFDNSDNESDQEQKKVTSRQQSNNITLNQYINNNYTQSYSNLLMTSAQYN